MKKCILLLFAILIFNLCNANHWEPDPYQFQNNMISIGVITIDGIEQRVDSLEVGAFCNEECRGSAMTTYNENFDRFFVFLMIYGEENDSISFKLYDHRIGCEPELVSLSMITFHINGQEGTATDPYEFVFESPEPPTYDVVVDVEPYNGGTATGSGTYVAGDTCIISATPNVGYSFLNFTENGNVVTTDADYSFQVTDNHNFIANFELNHYEVTASANPEGSAVIYGGGVYEYGMSCTVVASPNEHWHFESWTADGNVVSTENIYSFVVTENLDLTANLFYFDDVNEAEYENVVVCPNPTCNYLIVKNLRQNYGDLQIFDLTGKLVYKIKVTSDVERIDLHGFAAGEYVLKTGDFTRKVVVN